MKNKRNRIKIDTIYNGDDTDDLLIILSFFKNTVINKIKDLLEIYNKLTEVFEKFFFLGH